MGSREGAGLLVNTVYGVRRIQRLVQQADGAGVAPLLHCCTNGFAELAALLIEHSAIVDGKRADNGFTPIMIASRNGEVKVVHVLLGARADVGLRDNRGQTALMHAARHGHDKVVQLLHDVHTENNRGEPIEMRHAHLDVHDYQSCTPLLFAGETQ